MPSEKIVALVVVALLWTATDCLGSVELFLGFLLVRATQLTEVVALQHHFVPRVNVETLLAVEIGRIRLEPALLRVIIMNVCLNLCLAASDGVLASILAPFEEKLGLLPSVQLLLPRILLLVTRVLSVRVNGFLVTFAASSVGTITLRADPDLVRDALGVLHVQITACTCPDRVRDLDHAMVPTGRALRLVPVAGLQRAHTIRHIFVQYVVVVVRSHIVGAALVLGLLEALLGRR